VLHTTVTRSPQFSAEIPLLFFTIDFLILSPTIKKCTFSSIDMLSRDHNASVPSLTPPAGPALACACSWIVRNTARDLY
jgi:hypothetical protein